MPSVQYILRKSLCRAPHCHGPHGKEFAEWTPAELESWRRTAESYIENMDYATEYGERGYDNPRKSILFSNWNLFPRGICELLESAGYSIEWEDEWTRCDGCGKAFRTSPDSYHWRRGIIYVEKCSAELCAECLDFEDIESEYLDNPKRAVNIDGLDLAALGYVEIECGFSVGWSTCSDNPEKIMADCHARGYKNVLFQISDTSQFECGFCVWHKPCGECGTRGWKYATRDDGRRAIERCDECEAIESDEAAAVIATAAGFVCSLEYPCFVFQAPRCECGAEFDDSCL